MSINDVPEIRRLFKAFHIREVKTRYTAAAQGSKPVTGLLIMNFTPPPAAR